MNVPWIQHKECTWIYTKQANQNPSEVYVPQNSTNIYEINPKSSNFYVPLVASGKRPSSGLSVLSWKWTTKMINKLN